MNDKTYILTFTQTERDDYESAWTVETVPMETVDYDAVAAVVGGPLVCFQMPLEVAGRKLDVWAHGDADGLPVNSMASLLVGELVHGNAVLCANDLYSGYFAPMTTEETFVVTTALMVFASGEDQYDVEYTSR